MSPNPKPQRIRLKRNSKAWRDLVAYVFRRDCFRCQVCGKPKSAQFLSPHHIRSVGAGGSDEEHNLITLCARHHRRYHDGILTPEERREYDTAVEIIRNG